MPPPILPDFGHLPMQAWDFLNGLRKAKPGSDSSVVPSGAVNVGKQAPLTGVRPGFRYVSRGGGGIVGPWAGGEVPEAGGVPRGPGGGVLHRVVYPVPSRIPSWRGPSP